jgi:hypothetical protein
MNDVVAARSPAGFWKRYVAYFIDLVVVWLVLELLEKLFFSGAESSQLEQLRQQLVAIQNQPTVSPDLPSAYQVQLSTAMQAMGLLLRMSMYSSIAYVVIGGAYFALCESSAWQATPGKRLLGIKVTDANGLRIGLGRAFGRFFAAGLSWLTLNLGHAMAAWTAEHRALHDYVAGTRVENADSAHPRMPPWGWMVVAAHALVFVLGVVAVVMAMAVVLTSVGQS